MAAVPRRLVFVLTMVAWLAASIHTGSSSSGWWGSQEALQLRQAAKRASIHGSFDQAERTYRRGAELAALHRDPLARAWFLDGAGDAGLIQFHYRSALSAYLDAQRAAQQARDPLALGAIEADLASLYQQMGDFDSALRAAEQARIVTRGLPGVYYRPQLLLLLGRLRNDATSIPLYREGIQATQAAELKDKSFAVVEANGWDYLTEALLARGDLDGAEAAVQRSMALRAKTPRDLGFPEWLLAEVRIGQSERTADPALREKLLSEAQGFTRAAAGARRGPPAYVLAGQRGRILLLLGRRQEGLEALEQSIDQVERWRAGIVAAPGFLDGEAIRVQTAIFDEFIQAAAAYGAETHASRWIAESFQAAELNRTVNLRDNALSSRHRVLPPGYWDVVGQLQAEELRLSGAGQSHSQLSDGLRLKLTELEARSGLGYSPKFIENFPTQASLIHFQASLRNSDLFLSIALGEGGSWLWAVTGNTLEVYRLPAAEQIVNTVRAFREAVQNRPAGKQGFQATELGQQLYSMLFGQLPAAEASRPHWQLSVDDVLLELPFAALVPELDQRSNRKVYLVEQHSLQVAAGALTAGPSPPTSATGFVGVGDPIYNAADDRWNSAAESRMARLKSRWTSLFSLTALAGSEELNRLPGTGREVETSAHAWRSGGGPVTLLEGAEATRARFLHAIASGPRVIHIATHALAAPSGDEAYLLFSLGLDGAPEMLGASEIRTLSLPGSLVAMTGCDTAPSGAPAGLGLAGLVRAWTIAGAGAVLATEWPVQDAAGDALLGSFYGHLRGAPQSPAAALQRAQVEAIRSGNSEPSAWAAYQVFTGHTGAGSDLP